MKGRYTARFKFFNGERHEVNGEDVAEIMSKIRKLMEGKDQTVVDLNIEPTVHAQRVGRRPGPLSLVQRREPDLGPQVVLQGVCPRLQAQSLVEGSEAGGDAQRVAEVRGLRR